METNKSKNLILILLFIVLVINISMMITFFLFPKGNKDPFDDKDCRHKHPHGRVNLVAQLELNPDQEVQFFALRDNHKQQMRIMFDSAKTIRNSMLDALLSDDESENGKNLYNYAEQMADVEYAIQKEAINYFLKMKEILNKDQFVKLIENFRNVCGCKRSSRNGENSRHCGEKNASPYNHKKRYSHK